MVTHEYTFTPDIRPTIHPSGRIAYLPTGLTKAVCVHCGSSFTIPSTDEPQRVFATRDTMFVVQRARL
jgi:hypothetical protein